MMALGGVLLFGSCALFGCAFVSVNRDSERNSRYDYDASIMTNGNEKMNI